MPAFIYWTLLPPIPATTAPVAEPSTASPDMPCPLEAITEAGFLAAFDRIFPSSYLAPMKSGAGAGYELFQAYGAIGERISTAVARTGCQAFIGSASGQSQAAVSVELSRATPILDGMTVVTVKAGTIITSSRSGRRFIIQADVIFNPADVGPFTVSATAVESGYEYNVVGQRVTAAGEIIPGELDTIEKLIEDPPYGDPTIQVVQIVDASGGSPAGLDQHGIDRDIRRQPGESSKDYRARIRALPDTVSPAAIRRAATRTFAKWGHGYLFLEAWQMGHAFDADVPGGQAFDMPDDPAFPFQNRYLDDLNDRGMFTIVVDSIGCVNMIGMAFDDPAGSDNDFISPDTLGARAVPACDVPIDLDNGIPAGAFDGVDLQHDAIYAGLWDVLQSIKAGGVEVNLELAGQ